MADLQSEVTQGGEANEPPLGQTMFTLEQTLIVEPFSFTLSCSKVPLS